MARLYQRPIFVLSVFAVPLLTFVAPSWAGLSGVAPCWAVLWLMPWSLLDGPLSGFIAGIALGLMLDGLSTGGFSHLPALMFLGWWWGWIGKRGALIERSLNLGLLAWLGTMLIGMSFFLQIWFLNNDFSGPLLRYWSFHTTLSQSILTGLLAPMMSSWLMLIWRRRSSI